MRHQQHKLKTQWRTKINFVSRTLFSALLITVLFAHIGNAEKKKQGNRLPPAPDTGSPEGDFAAGGTRDSRLQNSWCGNNDKQAAYLLGNRNREYTQAAYPTFWFNFPNTRAEVAQINLIVTELETGSRIYDRTIPHPQQAGIIGISLPRDRQHALAPEKNYSWTLKVQCANQAEAKVALEGWISRKPLDPQLQSQLASMPKLARHQVYVEQNLWYDALTTIAQHHITRPNHNETTTAWHEFLAELGWRELIRDNATAPAMLVQTER